MPCGFIAWLIFYDSTSSNFWRGSSLISIASSQASKSIPAQKSAGVVIGETAEVGDNVLMYQGVVLGGTSLKKEKRHPTVGNNVVIGTGAVALGAITISDGARIGSGSVVVKSVPAGATVVGIPGRIVEDRHKPLIDLEHGKLPDPIAEAIRLVLKEQEKLGERLKRLESLSGLAVPDDEFRDRRIEIVKELSQGGEI